MCNDFGGMGQKGANRGKYDESANTLKSSKSKKMQKYVKKVLQLNVRLSATENK